MFDNKQNTATNTNSVIATWYSKTCKLRIGAWNERISLQFSESTGQDSNGMTTYTDKPVSTALTQENASVLLAKIESNIMPHVIAEDDVEVNTMVPIGIGDNPNALMIERKVGDDGKMHVSMVFYKGLSADGKATSATQVLTYEFNNMEYMVNFNCNTGEGESGTLSGQFITFYTILKNRSDLLQLNAHATKHLKNMQSKYSGGNGFSGGFSKPATPATGGFSSAFDALEEELPFS